MIETEKFAKCWAGSMKKRKKVAAQRQLAGCSALAKCQVLGQKEEEEDSLCLGLMQGTLLSVSTWNISETQGTQGRT